MGANFLVLCDEFSFLDIDDWVFVDWFAIHVEDAVGSGIWIIVEVFLALGVILLLSFKIYILATYLSRSYRIQWNQFVLFKFDSLACSSNILKPPCWKRMNMDRIEPECYIYRIILGEKLIKIFEISLNYRWLYFEKINS